MTSTTARTVTTAAAATLAGLALSLTASPSQASAPVPYLHGAVGDAVKRPCAQEDGVNCHWDAGTSGNVAGHSFYSVRVGNKVCTIYTAYAYNRAHGYCTKL